MPKFDKLRELQEVLLARKVVITLPEIDMRSSVCLFGANMDDEPEEESVHHGKNNKLQ